MDALTPNTTPTTQVCGVVTCNMTPYYIYILHCATCSPHTPHTRHIIYTALRNMFSPHTSYSQDSTTSQASITSFSAIACQCWGDCCCLWGEGSSSLSPHEGDRVRLSPPFPSPLTSSSSLSSQLSSLTCSCTFYNSCTPSQLTPPP